VGFGERRRRACDVEVMRLWCGGWVASVGEGRLRGVSGVFGGVGGESECGGGGRGGGRVEVVVVVAFRGVVCVVWCVRWPGWEGCGGSGFLVLAGWGWYSGGLCGLVVGGCWWGVGGLWGVCVSVGGFSVVRELGWGLLGGWRVWGCGVLCLFGVFICFWLCGVLLALGLGGRCVWVVGWVVCWCSRGFVLGLAMWCWVVVGWCVVGASVGCRSSRGGWVVWGGVARGRGGGSGLW